MKINFERYVSHTMHTHACIHTHTYTQEVRSCNLHAVYLG